MNKYDLNTIHTRYGIGSKKWDEIKEYNPDTTDNIVPFSVADMEFMTAPEIREGLKSFIDNNILGYSNPWPEYLNAVKGWMKKRHNWDIDTSWICNTHGVVDAFYVAIKAFTKETEGVMLMTPVYYPMYNAIKNNNRVLVENKLVKEGSTYKIDFEDFEKKASDKNTKIFILCSPHNPVGRVWTEEELRRIADICIKNDVLIVSDEIHFDFVSPGYKHTVFATLSEKVADNCLTLTAPSKTFNLAGLQTSNIIIKNPKLMERFVQELKTTAVNPKCNILGYEACRIAYTECEEWLEEVSKVIIKNRDIIKDFIAREIPEIEIIDLEGTYLLWMDFNKLGINHLELEKLMKKTAGIFFDEGYVFGEEGIGFERWNLACPTQCIEDALIRLKKALKNN